MNRVEDKHGLSFLPSRFDRTFSQTKVCHCDTSHLLSRISDPCEQSLAGHQKIEKDSNSIQ